MMIGFGRIGIGLWYKQGVSLALKMSDNFFYKVSSRSSSNKREEAFMIVICNIRLVIIRIRSERFFNVICMVATDSPTFCHFLCANNKSTQTVLFWSFFTEAPKGQPGEFKGRLPH